MKTAFLLLCLLGRTCLAQDLSPGDRAVLDYTAKSIAGAKSILILYTERQKDRPAVFAEFSDKEWQLKFADLLNHSDAKTQPRIAIHAGDLADFPVVIVKESKLSVDCSDKKWISVEVDGKPLKLLDYVADTRQLELLLELIDQKRPKEALLPTPDPVMPAAGVPVAPAAGEAHL
jgi:hypothetical protein